MNADPAAVVFDAVAKIKPVIPCRYRGYSRRLHTRTNLMEELKKIKKNYQQGTAGSGAGILLILDATTGQKALFKRKYLRKTSALPVLLD